MIDLKNEIERELSRIEPPDLWDRIRADAAAAANAAISDLITDRQARRPPPWLAVAAVIVLLSLAAALPLLDEDETVDTQPVSDPTTTSAPPTWSGPALDRGTLVHPMTEISVEPVISEFVWQDPRDAAVDFVDVARVRFLEPHAANNGHWYFDLAAVPPPIADLEPGMVVTYGVAFDTNADGVADYIAGIDNDAPVRGDFRAWITDVAAGHTREQVGPPYGFPVEFGYPGEEDPTYPVFLTFLGNDGRSTPAGLNTQTARFYVWTAVTRDGVLVANDYAPDTGWMSGG